MDLHESEDSMVYVVSSTISDCFLKTLSSHVQKSCFNMSASLSETFSCRYGNMFSTSLVLGPFLL